MAQARSEVLVNTILERYPQFLSERNLNHLQPIIEDTFTDQPFLTPEQKQRELIKVLLESYDDSEDVSSETTKESVFLLVVALQKAIDDFIHDGIVEIKAEIEKAEVTFRDEATTKSEREEAQRFIAEAKAELELLAEEGQRFEIFLLSAMAMAFMIQPLSEAEAEANLEAKLVFSQLSEALDRYFENVFPDEGE
jgi:hypothetical protein